MRSILPALVLLILSLGPVPARADAGSAADPLPSPWKLSARAPGEPSWAGLLRLREAEPAFLGDDEAVDLNARWAYCQVRAYAEAALGRHLTALRMFDAVGGGPDSVGTVPEGVRAVPAVDVLVAAADTARVIMINERHHAASDRLLTLRLLAPLREKGFRYLAAEAFDSSDSTLEERGYPVEGTGYYVDEPVFGEIVREALRLGYTLVPYEREKGQDENDETVNAQQRRDRAQARNLRDRIFRQDPDAKVLVHAGIAHVKETVESDWHPMAVYFRELTGIDPVTVDQTRLSERSTPEREHPAYRAAIAAGLVQGDPVVLVQADGRPWSPIDFPVDFQVFGPRTTVTEGRPDWMAAAGREPVEVSVPEGLDRWCLVEARVPGEPEDAVALDRAEAEGTERVRLYVPAVRHVEVRVLAEDGKLLRVEDLGSRDAAQ